MRSLLLAVPVLALAGCSAGTAFGVTMLALATYQASENGWEAKDGEPRRPPPMAPDRKVSEVDCSQPIDFSLGNIRCK